MLNLKSIVRSVLDYGYFIFGNAPTSVLMKLDRIQYSVLRSCLGVLRTSPCNAMEIEGNLMPLGIR
jgi:hypothetical protein